MKPIAFMCPTGLEYKQRATDFMYNDALYDTKLNWIPLYTHPVKEITEDDGKVCARCGAIAYDPVIPQTVKELTDEEIFEVSAQFPFIESGYERYEFARAILRKAQNDQK